MRRTSIASIVVVAAALVPAHAQKPRTHRLEATPATVAYGYYWAEAKPALRIASGDIIDVDTLLTNSPAGLEKAGLPPARIQASLKAIVSEVTGDRRGPGGHILTGPVYVEGAEPGDILEVKVLSIDLPIDYGYNGCSGFLPENCDKSLPSKIVALDRTRMTAEFLPGIVIPLRPFFGSMGVAPAAELGRVSSNPPGRHAGNLDNKELVAGSTLYIPVFVRGALFEVGDGHAAQGDGEVDQTAIETSLRGRLQLTVRKSATPLTWPRAETPTDFISMASDPDLTTATRLAVQEMIDFLAARNGLTKHQAYQLVSVAGNVAVTQLVDKPVMGVHVRMPKSIFSSTKTDVLALTSAPADNATSRAKEVVALTNVERTRAGRTAFASSARLMRAAQLHAEQMARLGRLDHILKGARYPRPEDRLATVKYSWQEWAENVAFGQEDAKAVVRSWMKSKGHRTNILDASLTELGVGYATDPQGRAYWVQVFGRPVQS